MKSFKVGAYISIILLLTVSKLPAESPKVIGALDTTGSPPIPLLQTGNDSSSGNPITATPASISQDTNSTGIAIPGNGMPEVEKKVSLRYLIFPLPKPLRGSNG